MNPDHDALLRTIVAHPEDDLPRLVFADFLEESGHPASVARAHFIRVQIEAEQHEAGSPEREKYEAFAAELRGQFRDEVDLILPESKQVGVTGIRRRGFVEEVHAREMELLDYGPLLVEVAPVTSLRVQMLANQRFLARGVTWLSSIRSFTLGKLYWPFYLDTEFWLEFIRHPHFTQLRTVNLSDNRLSDDWVVLFVSELPATAFAQTLRELILVRTDISDRGANTLAAARGVEALTKLDLRENRITESGAEVLRRRFGERVILD